MDAGLEIMGRVLLAFALAVAGGVLSASMPPSHKRLCALISLAAGTLLGATLFAILPETAHAMRWWELLLAMASGYALFFLISKYVHHVCPACAASHFDEETTHRFSEIATALLIALAIHSTSDGLALAAGHDAAHGHGETHHGLDWSLLLAICIHKIPEGLALGALLIGAGFRRMAAVGWVAAAESMTLLGGGIGIGWFDHISPFWLSAILAHVGGGFLYLAAHAVLGEMIKHDKRVVIENALLGVALIGGVSLALRWL